MTPVNFRVPGVPSCKQDFDVLRVNIPEYCLASGIFYVLSQRNVLTEISKLGYSCSQNQHLL